MKSDTLYVVWNEHTLGYIKTWAPQLVGVLHASVLRGATCAYGPHYLCANDNFDKELRPATAEDFNAYRVCLPPDYELATREQLNQVLAPVKATAKVPA